MKNALIVVGMLAVAVFVTTSVALAAEATPGEKQPLTIAHGLLGLAAAVAVAGGAIGTAWAQSRIGSAGAGALAERPEIFGSLFVFLVLPETLIILGFVIAFLILQKI